MNGTRLEGVAQLAILLGVGTMAGAASFTHVHDWTMTNSPEGTGDWFGWANAVISELTPICAALEIRRRKRHHQSVRYPMAVLVIAAAFSIAAQLAVAKPGITGGLISAIPALAFLALTKLVLSRTSPVVVPGDVIPAFTPVGDEGLALVEHADSTRLDQPPVPVEPAAQLPAGPTQPTFAINLPTADGGSVNGSPALGGRP